MNVIIAADTSNRSNWGCRATSNALGMLVQSRGNLIGRVDFSNASLAPFQSFQEGDHGLLTKAVGKIPGSSFLLGLGQTAAALSRTSIRTVTAKSLDKFSDHIAEGIAYPELAKALANADWLVVNGEGAIIQNRPFGRLCFLLAYVAKTRFGKKCAIVNHTADTRHPVLREMAEAVYPCIDVAVFRERFSYELNKDICGTARAVLAADAVFAYKPCDRQALLQVANRPGYYSIFPDMTDFDLSKPYICVGGSAHYLAEKFSWDKVRNAFLSLSKALLDRAQVVITAASHPDDAILRPVARQLGLPYVNLNTPTSQALDILGNASLYVGGRWHPAIMSLSGGVPMILFSSNTDFKTRGLLDLFQLEQPQWSSLEFGQDIPAIVALADKLLAGGDGLRESIKNRADELRSLSYKNVDFL